MLVGVFFLICTSDLSNTTGKDIQSFFSRKENLGLTYHVIYILGTFFFFFELLGRLQIQDEKLKENFDCLILGFPTPNL